SEVVRATRCGRSRPKRRRSWRRWSPPPLRVCRNEACGPRVDSRLPVPVPAAAGRQLSLLSQLLRLRARGGRQTRRREGELACPAPDPALSPVSSWWLRPGALNPAAAHRRFATPPRQAVMDTQRLILFVIFSF